jgi:hypothetical protein
MMFGSRYSNELNKRTLELLERLESVSQELAETRGTFEGSKRALQLSKSVTELREEIEKLKIERSTVTEQHEREKRETEHMVGLQRKRGEFEIEAAKREATLIVREEQLTAQREQFKQEQTFRQERFDEQVEYLQGLMSQILKRLPTIGVQLKDDAKPLIKDKDD